MSAPVDCVPCKPLPPVQASEAVQEVAFVEDHCSVVLALLLTELCRAVRLRVGAGPVTETVVDCAALPPVPLHDSE
jgi:hypothetical protein